MVERYRETLTKTYDTFGTKWVGRVHRIRDIEIGITEVDVGADLLE